MENGLDTLTVIRRKIRTGLLPYSNVTAAYLLGSPLTGRMRADSDIDLALLIGSGEGLDWEQRIRMAGELEQQLGRTVDLYHFLKLSGIKQALFGFAVAHPKRGLFHSIRHLDKLCGTRLFAVA